MKFDNVKPITAEARDIALPAGTFSCKNFDRRAPLYNRIFDELMAPVSKLAKAKALSPEKDREIMIRAFIRTSVVGWSGVTSNGANVPFSEDNCVDLLTQDPQTFYDLMDEAAEVNNFRLSLDGVKN